MVREEFDTWIVQHYEEALKVARRRTNSDDDAADVLQHAIASSLENRWYERSARPWTRMVLSIRQAASNFRRSAARQTAALRILHGAGASHGRRKSTPRAE